METEERAMAVRVLLLVNWEIHFGGVEAAKKTEHLQCQSLDIGYSLLDIGCSEGERRVRYKIADKIYVVASRPE